MKNLIKLLEHTLLYPLSYLVPRRPQRWVFGAPEGRFEGNSKYLYLWVSTRARDLDAVWITPNRALEERLTSLGLNAIARASPKGAYYALTAKYFFVNSNGDDINFALSGGAEVFNLWHGVGIKNILRKSTVGLNSKIFKSRWFAPLYLRSLQRFKRPAFVLSTSEMMSEHFSECFDVPAARCLQLGYPRQDPAFDPDFRAYCASIEPNRSMDALSEKFSEIYVYAPTLRQRATAFLEDAIPNFAALSSALRERGGLLLIKLHPRDHSSVEEACAGFENIKPWPSDCDLYTHFASVDCLITDYSSLLYDWLEVRDRGVILYPFDYERFVAEERDLAYPYEDNVTGAWAGNFATLCETIQNGSAMAVIAQDDLNRLRERFWGRDRPRRSSSVRIVEFLRPDGP